jgi:hypothetical protein
MPTTHMVVEHFKNNDALSVPAGFGTAATWLLRA